MRCLSRTCILSALLAVLTLALCVAASASGEGDGSSRDGAEWNLIGMREARTDKPDMALAATYFRNAWMAQRSIVIDTRDTLQQLREDLHEARDDADAAAEEAEENDSDEEDEDSSANEEVEEAEREIQSIKQTIKATRLILKQQQDLAADYLNNHAVSLMRQKKMQQSVTQGAPADRAKQALRKCSSRAFVGSSAQSIEAAASRLAVE